MNKEAAEKFQILAIQFSGWLNGRLNDLSRECTEEELKEMRKYFGQAMGSMFLDVMKPMYLEHPELKPEELGGPYKVDRRIYFDQDDGKFKIPE